MAPSGGHPAAPRRPACVPRLDLREANPGPTTAELLRSQIMATAAATTAEHEALAERMGAQKAFDHLAARERVALHRAHKQVPVTMLQGLDEAKRSRLQAFRQGRRARRSTPPSTSPSLRPPAATHMSGTGPGGAASDRVVVVATNAGRRVGARQMAAHLPSTRTRGTSGASIRNTFVQHGPASIRPAQPPAAPPGGGGGTSRREQRRKSVDV